MSVTDVGKSRDRISPSAAAILLLVIAVFAAVFRLWDLGGPSLWLDELSSVSFAELPQHQLWSNWMVRETNPPLYYSLLQVWIDAFGRGEFATRSLAVAAGVLSVPAMYLVGREVHSREAGLAAALLTAVSSQQLQFSQQVRGYALGFLAAALALYALLRLTDRWLDKASSHLQAAPHLALYTGATGLAVYTHTTFFLLPLLANLYIAWLWWFRAGRDWRAATGWVVANVALLILCSWWLWITYLQLTTDGGAAPIEWIEQPTLRTAILRLQHVYFARKLGLGSYVVGAAFTAAAAWGLWRVSLERRVLLATVIVGLPLFLLLLSVKQPVYLERTLFWAQAAYIPAVAAGAVALPMRRLALPAVLVLATVWFADAVIWRRDYYREPWRDIAQVVAARAGPRDALLMKSPHAMVDLGYYCTGRCAAVPHIAAKGPRDVLGPYFRGRQVGPADIGGALEGVDHIWVVHRGGGHELERLLAGVAVEEVPDVLAVDPLVKDKPGHGGRMRLSKWRVVVAPQGR
jgi:uncharacterized membrane protein